MTRSGPVAGTPSVAAVPTAPAALVGLAVLAALVLVPAASAEEPEDAPALWTELYGDEGVESLVFTPRTIGAGEHFETVLSFTEEVNVSDVKYQICYIGQGCFAIGVPTTEVEPGTWRIDTRDINEHTGYEKDINFQRQPVHDPQPTRIGIQFFVCTTDDVPCPDNPLEWRPFPVGESGCAQQPSPEAFRACEETHYFGITIEESRAVPGPGLPVALAVIALGALAVRRP